MVSVLILWGGEELVELFGLLFCKNSTLAFDEQAPHGCVEYANLRTSEEVQGRVRTGTCHR